MAAKSKVRQPAFNFVDESRQIGIYSDVFTVEMEPETGMVGITFFQSGSKFDPTRFGEAQEIKDKDIRFLSKIYLSPRGFSVLLNSLVGNAQAVNKAVEDAVKQATETASAKIIAPIPFAAKLTE